jgi:hypothetical protein
MKPARTITFKDFAEIKVSGLQLGDSGVTPIRYAYRSSYTKSTLCEIKSIPHVATHAIEVPPDYLLGVYSTLKNQILYKSSNLIICKRGENCRIQAKAFTKPTRYVVLAPAFPNIKATSCANPAISRIKAEHDFS